jgi:putative transposase
MNDFHRRHLPHLQPWNATFFITFRLAGSIADPVATQMREDLVGRQRKTMHEGQKDLVKELWCTQLEEHFTKVDEFLGQRTSGPLWLQDDRIASLVSSAIHFKNHRDYLLHAFTIMPDHVHLVFSLGEGILGAGNRGSINGNLVDPGKPYRVSRILGSIKKYTALRANAFLGRKGAFWQDESYDHVVRDGDELERIIWYVLMNPVKAGLVRDWEDWKWTYLEDGLIKL